MRGSGSRSGGGEGNDRGHCRTPQSYQAFARHRQRRLGPASAVTRAESGRSAAGRASVPGVGRQWRRDRGRHRGRQAGGKAGGSAGAWAAAAARLRRRRPGTCARRRSQRPLALATPARPRPAISRATLRPRSRPSRLKRAQRLARCRAAFGDPQDDGAADRPGAAVGDRDLRHDADDRDQADQLPRQLAEQRARRRARPGSRRSARFGSPSRPDGQHQPIAHEQLVLGEDDHVAEVQRRRQDAAPPRRDPR